MYIKVKIFFGLAANAKFHIYFYSNITGSIHKYRMAAVLVTVNPGFMVCFSVFGMYVIQSWSCSDRITMIKPNWSSWHSHHLLPCKHATTDHCWFSLFLLTAGWERLQSAWFDHLLGFFHTACTFRLSPHPVTQFLGEALMKRYS